MRSVGLSGEAARFNTRALEPAPGKSVPALDVCNTFDASSHQASSIEDFAWPVSDPNSVVQQSRPLKPTDERMVDDCLSTVRGSLPQVIGDALKLRLSKAETILRILSDRRFQMNPVSEVRNEHEWLDRIEYAVDRGQPIDIVYPLFCVIPSAVKRYSTIGPTAGEDCTIRFFGLIDDAVKQVYTPGIRICALADAALFADAFGTPQADIDAYQERLAREIASLGAQDYLRLYDYAELIDSECHEEYNALHIQLGNLATHGRVDEVLPNVNLDGLRKSVRASINTRALPLSHHDHLALFGPLQYRDPANPYYDIVEHLTDVALAEYVAVRSSCDKLDIASRLWPHALRSTCHKGIRNGRWPLGLRPYPEYFGSCKLLPYHGMPCIRQGKHGTKLEVLPEVMLRGDTSLVRVTAQDPSEVFAYVSAEIEVGSQL